MSKPGLTRRTVAAGMAVGVAGAAATLFVPGARSTTLGYAFRGPAADRGLGLAPPAACTPGTVGRTAGPFYTPSTPRRASLREPGSGEPLILQGLALTTDCRPVPGAVVDLWHCDERGRYDNSGFRYRGHQFTDAAGAFRFETIRPVRYTGRTPHFHVKLQGEKTRLLTTQLFFPDLHEANRRDFIYRDELRMRLGREDGIWRARFDFVLAPA